MDITKIDKTFDVAVNGSENFMKLIILDVDEDYCYGITPRNFSLYKNEVIKGKEIDKKHSVVIKIVEENSVFREI